MRMWLICILNPVTDCFLARAGADRCVTWKCLNKDEFVRIDSRTERTRRRSNCFLHLCSMVNSTNMKTGAGSSRSMSM